VKLALHGATGRMGQAIARLAHAAGDIQIVGAVCAASDPACGRDLGEVAGIGTLGVVATPDVAAGLLGAEVVIDFSTAGAVPELLSIAVRHEIAVMSGTTNLDSAGKLALEKAASRIPLLWAPNTSLGVQVLAELVEQALRRLGPDYDVEIVEIHHRKKVDSPSGTAKRLADAAHKARAGLWAVTGREGDCGPRKSDEMGIFGVRGGDVVGDHTVYLLGPGERIELTHRASNRDLFAHGAIRGARFVFGRQPGLYTMSDVR
jgi:4-hydroxy-tetrahydrodipicolinate reductase